jgi:hypothetical protein
LAPSASMFEMASFTLSTYPKTISSSSFPVPVKSIGGAYSMSIFAGSGTGSP